MRNFLGVFKYLKIKLPKYDDCNNVFSVLIINIKMSDLKLNQS